MEFIGTYSKTREILLKHDFQAKKSFGQNFLVDGHVLDKIVNSAEITKEDCVIEIGPGIGGLTERLSNNAGKVIAIEIDKKLIPILNETLEKYNNVEIINDDILKINLPDIIERNRFKNTKVVANLPYYITTPIVMELLENKYDIDSITIMVQKEVAERMKSQPRQKAYGALSLAVQYYSLPKIIATVPQNCFIPRPNVDSSVIQLKTLKEPIVKVIDSSFMFKIIKASFGQRRKTLVNCLYNSDFINLSKDEIAQILTSLQFDVNIRGESLGLNEFAKLSDAFFNEKINKT